MLSFQEKVYYVEWGSAACLNGEPQLQNKRGRLTTLDVINEAENGGSLLQNKGDNVKL